MLSQWLYLRNEIKSCFAFMFVSGFFARIITSIILWVSWFNKQCKDNAVYLLTDSEIPLLTQNSECKQSFASITTLKCFTHFLQDSIPPPTPTPASITHLSPSSFSAPRPRTGLPQGKKSKWDWAPAKEPLLTLPQDGTGGGTRWQYST